MELAGCFLVPTRLRAIMKSVTNYIPDRDYIITIHIMLFLPVICVSKGMLN